MNKDIMRAMGFGEMVKLVEQGKCPFCKEEVKMEDFEDELSKKDFEVTGLCQKCQNETYNGKGG